MQPHILVYSFFIIFSFLIYFLIHMTGIEPVSS
nr:MAG TPA: hypothetical protein [Bacteriophage sp.]